MAGNSFLDKQSLEEARLFLKPFLKNAQDFSLWISKKILSDLEKNSLWLKAHPILLGSWARSEICIKSDLDVLFLGSEDDVAELVRQIQMQGIKIRYRMPKNPQDWSEGVEAWDLMALHKAQPLTIEGGKALIYQQKMIFNKKKNLNRFLRSIRDEKKIRLTRYDSIQSFLEPNIKYGPGGLRDLYQGLILLDFFEDKFSDINYEKNLLLYYRDFFLLIRHWLHLFGSGGDILSGHDQIGLFQWLGYKNLSDFMKEVQKGLSRVSFYANWIVAKGLTKLSEKSSKKRKDNLYVNKLSLDNLYKSLKKNPDILTQHKVRRQMDLLSQKDLSPKIRGRILTDLFRPETSESVVVAVFHSRLIDKLMPRFKRLVGYVQHDQYHRYTADAHILQTCRWMKKLQRNEIKQDQIILGWTALYHDLAKGCKGDHEKIGSKWVRSDLKKNGISNFIIQEVVWLVKNHLQLSIAAFRKNPSSPETWKELWDLGLTDRRLHLLAAFTKIDILATNPEAWNKWKSRLLNQLVQRLLEGGTKNYLRILEEIPKNFPKEVLERLDPQIFLEIPRKKFQADLLKTWLNKSDSKDSSKCVVPVKRQKSGKYCYWIRFSRRQDEPGLLAKFVGHLYGVGCSVQHALVHTSNELGVYDWFLIESGRREDLLLKLLDNETTELNKILNKIKIQSVKFQSIEVISKSSDELVVSLKGMDQKGMLYSAAQVFFELGANILSARVHTWGRQVEDLFSIDPPKDLEDFLKNLRLKLLEPV